METTGENNNEDATSLALDINEGLEGSDPSSMVFYHDKLYFAVVQKELRKSSLEGSHAPGPHIYV